MAATKLAMQYRCRFKKEVFVEIHCFRRWGHNELDDPTFTNPLLYEKITARQSVPDMYVASLKEQSILNDSETSHILNNHNDLLSTNFKDIESYEPPQQNLKGKIIIRSHMLKIKILILLIRKLVQNDTSWRVDNTMGHWTY